MGNVQIGQTIHHPEVRFAVGEIDRSEYRCGKIRAWTIDASETWRKFDGLWGVVELKKLPDDPKECKTEYDRWFKATFGEIKDGVKIHPIRDGSGVIVEGVNDHAYRDGHLPAGIVL